MTTTHWCAMLLQVTLRRDEHNVSWVRSRAVGAVSMAGHYGASRLCACVCVCVYVSVSLCLCVSVFVCLKCVRECFNVSMGGAF